MADQTEDNIIKKISLTIMRHSMLSGGETVLTGLSGGPDSVCLLLALRDLMKEFNLKLHAVYIDHGLRPDETPDEVLFCKKICGELRVPFHTKAVDVKTFAREYGMNKQDAARELRYRAFEEAAMAINAGRIAVGHNADDQLETFFLRLLRGSGPKGLSGIPPVRGRIIRPLIDIERTEIEKFLVKRRVGYIIDSSNLKEYYLRNKIRTSFIPEIKKINPDITYTMSHTMEILREEERYWENIVTKSLMKLISRKRDSRIELFLAPMEAMDKVILRRVLRRAVDETRGLRSIGFMHIEAVIGLIKNSRHGDRICLPGGLRVIKNYSTLVMTSEPPLRIKNCILNVPGETVIRDSAAVIRAYLEDSAPEYGDGRSVIVLDAGKVNIPLAVRARTQGDFFYPMGFGRRKKLQDFFVDEKVPRDERDSVPLIVSGTDIVWIAGYRGNDRFKTTADTKKFLKMEIKAGFA